jgi:hypothetical protein
MAFVGLRMVQKNGVSEINSNEGKEKGILKPY